MKVTLAKKDNRNQTFLVHDMPSYSFGVDNFGILYVRTFGAVHQLSDNAKSWKHKIKHYIDPDIEVRILQPGDKIVLEIE